jgi:hypothetical protein
MRILVAMSCLLLACCAPLSSQQYSAVSNNAATDVNAAADDALNTVADVGLADPGPPVEVSAAKLALFDLPESDLKTECAAADYYADHQVHPAFYGYPSPPEYDRYMECLLAEARRDGGRVRQASAGSFPKVGTCYSARIVGIGSRFGGDRPDRDGGTQVAFDMGLSLVDYSYVGAVARSRVGDEVRVCVHDLPEDCPGYDLRGIGYRTSNLRTGERWVMSDSQHMCRGA